MTKLHPKSKPIMAPADIEWRNGAPYSTRFNDIYFMPKQGEEESKYVFIESIGLEEKLKQNHSTVIAETGFGSGLNFMLAWDLFKRVAPPNAYLHYISVDAYPLSKQDIKRTLSQTSLPKELIDEFISNYPPLYQGFHSCSLNGGSVELMLMFGDAEACFSKLDALVDVWFLDGFDPAKNPNMWSEKLFQQISRLSKPGSVFATYTAQGELRRRLSQAGFEVERKKGFGNKRHMATGVLNSKPTSAPLIKSQPKALNISIIGAGVAGCLAAYELKKYTPNITLYDRHNGVAQEASGNPYALINPRLTADLSPAGLFGAMAYMYAVRFYDALESEGHAVWADTQRGLASLCDSEKTKERQQKFVERMALPSDYMHFISKSEIKEKTGIAPIHMDGLFYPHGGCVVPYNLCRALIEGLNVVCGEEVGFEKNGNRWNILDSQRRVIHQSDVVVVATANQARIFPELRYGIIPNRGQLTYIESEIFPTNIPLTFKSYISPPFKTKNGSHKRILGSTYERYMDLTKNFSVLKEEGHMKNIQKFLKVFPQYTQKFNDINIALLSGRASLRATTQDRYPVVGPLTSEGQGVYVISGLGSRGFQIAPLCAKVLASLIFQQPVPIPNNLLTRLSPKRFKKLYMK